MQEIEPYEKEGEKRYKLRVARKAAEAFLVDRCYIELSSQKQNV